MPADAKQEKVNTNRMVKVEKRMSGPFTYILTDEAEGGILVP
jgi:hypothetical protein